MKVVATMVFDTNNNLANTMMIIHKLKALLATARIANVPSVICNVFTGMVLARNSNDPTVLNLTWIFAVFAGVCLYVAGNFLNDWKDVEWDRKHRPERAIPRGLFSRHLYISISVLLASMGLILVYLLSKTLLFVYLAIAVCVYLYTLFHKRYLFSIGIMGMCRAGLYLLGFVAMDAGWRRFGGMPYQDAVIPGLGMMCYIMGISLLARYETRENELTKNPRRLAILFLLIPCVTHVYDMTDHIFFSDTVPLQFQFYDYLVILPFILWTSWSIFRKMPVSQRVGCLLAGIPLVDSVLLFFKFSVFPYEYEMGWSLIIIPVLCFLAALLLQKIAPAT